MYITICLAHLCFVCVGRIMKNVFIWYCFSFKVYCKQK